MIGLYNDMNRDFSLFLESLSCSSTYLYDWFKNKQILKEAFENCLVINCVTDFVNLHRLIRLMDIKNVPD